MFPGKSVTLLLMTVSTDCSRARHFLFFSAEAALEFPSFAHLNLVSLTLTQHTKKVLHSLNAYVCLGNSTFFNFKIFTYIQHLGFWFIENVLGTPRPFNLFCHLIMLIILYFSLPSVSPFTRSTSLEIKHNQIFLIFKGKNSV